MENWKQYFLHPVGTKRPTHTDFEKWVHSITADRNILEVNCETGPDLSLVWSIRWIGEYPPIPPDEFMSYLTIDSKQSREAYHKRRESLDGSSGIVPTDTCITGETRYAFHPPK